MSSCKLQPESIEPFYRLFQQSAVCRSDVLRLFLLHAYGGLYLDHDIACWRNGEDMLADQDVVLQATPEIEGGTNAGRFSVLQTDTRNCCRIHTAKTMQELAVHVTSWRSLCGMRRRWVSSLHRCPQQENSIWHHAHHCVLARSL